MRLSELLRRDVVTEAGERLGHIHDVRGELSAGRLRVTGLMAGGLGLMERYGIRSAALSGPPAQLAHLHRVVTWDRVVEVGEEHISVREG